MLQEQREKLVHSIICGYSLYKGLRLKRPSYDVEYKADIIYEETLADALNSQILRSEEVVTKLYDYEVWDFEKEERFQAIPKLLEECKLNLYESRQHTSQLIGIRNELKKLRTEYSTLFTTRHSYDSYTAEGIANFAKLCYIVHASTFLGKKLYRYSKETLETIIAEFQKNTIGEETLRELGRTEPWTTYWTVIKAGISIFKGEITEEQRKLIRISSFYDNLRGSPDCPTDSVIEDDDMLDGFLISQRKKRDTESNEKDVESMLTDKVANSSEIYIVCEDEKEAKKVQDLNSNYAKSIQTMRNKVIDEKGRVCEVDLPDVKKKLMMEMAKGGM